MLLRPEASFPLALRLRASGAPLGEVFAFLSGLYFRGKLAYSQAFAGPDGVRVITPSCGLVPAETLVTIADLKGYAEVPVDLAESRYFVPLVATAKALRDSQESDHEVVLLGSVASGKYVDCLLPIFGERLLFPADFVGRGDMSRGGLLLRSVAAGVELDYRPVIGAVRRGARPPRLAPRA